MRSVVVATLTVAAIVVPTTMAAQQGGRGIGKPTAGTRSLGDSLLPQLGNGGYDVEHYTIAIDYDPVANRFDAAAVEILAVATQHLTEISFDFQDGLLVSAVTVDGRPALHRFEAAAPALTNDPEVTRPMKLVIVPHPSSWPRPGRAFTVRIAYSGTPQPIVDPDHSIEGWIQACWPLAAPRTCDGAFVVNEPMGAQSWFPSNNHPADKATFDTIIRVPGEKTALGIGELVSRIVNDDGTATWHWREDDPTATYLTTATVGDFLYDVGSMTETSTGRQLPIYSAVDASAAPLHLARITASLAALGGQLDFLADLYGPYPFDSTGAVADRAAGVGYALEVQTKPHYAGSFNGGVPSIGIVTQLHELAHQWWGNSVTPVSWSDLWFNEGWVTWSEWYWRFRERGGSDPAAIFDELYANATAEDWAIAPAVLGRDPVNLFRHFSTYLRGAMALQGYREIVGDARFFALARTIQTERRHGNISTAEFIAFAKRHSGLTGNALDLLDDYFEEWLYGESKPTILPERFD